MELSGGHDPLSVEDHRATRTFLADNLAADGYEILESECGGEARRLMEIEISPIWRSSTSAFPTATAWSLSARSARPTASPTGCDPDLPLLVLSGRGTGARPAPGISRRGCDDHRQPFHTRSTRNGGTIVYQLTVGRPL